MKRLLLSLAVVALAAMSCQKDFVENSNDTEIKGIEEQTSPYAVSEEEAISLLMSALDDMTTRGEDKREVVSINAVSTSHVLSAETRTAESNIPEDLLYIVSFGENNGSAVLGADIRIKPILAILDKTVLTLDDFINNELTRTSCNELGDEEILKNNIITAIEKSAEAQILNSSITLPLLPVYSEFETVITTIRHIEPMLRTKWGQGYPYNIEHPNYPNNASVAMGCVPVAIAQFLYYHRWPASGNLYGEHFDWELMEETEYDRENPSIESLQEVSRFMYTIGNHIGAYGTGCSIGQLCDILSDLGITSSFINFNIDILSELIENKGPVCMRGSSSPTADGHAWIIDGWLIQNEKFIEYIYNKFGTLQDTRILENSTEYRIHCNFGWKGECDGYYSYTVLGFDTTQELPDEFVDTEHGDDQGSNYGDDYNFDSTFKMVQY